MHIGGGLAVAKGLRKAPEHFGDFEYVEHQVLEHRLGRRGLSIDRSGLYLH